MKHIIVYIFKNQTVRINVKKVGYLTTTAYPTYHDYLLQLILPITTTYHSLPSGSNKSRVCLL